MVDLVDLLLTVSNSQFSAILAVGSGNKNLHIQHFDIEAFSGEYTKEKKFIKNSLDSVAIFPLNNL